MQHDRWPPQLLRDVDELFVNPIVDHLPTAHQPETREACGIMTDPPLAVRTFALEEGPSKTATRQAVMEQSSNLKVRRTLILCFDGTGNKFQGTAADSNSIPNHQCIPTCLLTNLEKLSRSSVSWTARMLPSVRICRIYDTL